jgi:transcriptional regulator of arginine metabolism
MKSYRQAVIRELVEQGSITSQEQLRTMLRERGIEVTQATLSRDIRELGLVKVPHEDGAHYEVPAHVTDPTPTLTRLLPTLYLGCDGVGNLLVVKTLVGGAQPVAAAIDWEEWPEVVGTIGGDDTILLILREAGNRDAVVGRIEGLAGIR